MLVNLQLFYEFFDQISNLIDKKIHLLDHENGNLCEVSLKMVYGRIDAVCIDWISKLNVEMGF